MRLRARSLLALALLCGVAQGCATRGYAQYRISGRALDESGRPLARSVVTLLDAYSAPSAPALPDGNRPFETDANGRFAIEASAEYRGLYLIWPGFVLLPFLAVANGFEVFEPLIGGKAFVPFVTLDALVDRLSSFPAKPPLLASGRVQLAVPDGRVAEAQLDPARDLRGPSIRWLLSPSVWISYLPSWEYDVGTIQISAPSPSGGVR